MDASNLEQASQDFRKNLPGYKQKSGDVAWEQAANQLQGQSKDINKNASKRGLLYSGIQQGAQHGAQGAMGSALAQRRSAINKAADEEAQRYEVGAAEAGLNQTALEQQTFNRLYGNAQTAEAQRFDLLRGLFGAAGSIAGSGMAGGSSPAPSTGAGYQQSAPYGSGGSFYEQAGPSAAPGSRYSLWNK